jgi:hypothetical protein
MDAFGIIIDNLLSTLERIEDSIRFTERYETE